jgi:hypothetical protein
MGGTVTDAGARRPSGSDPRSDLHRSHPSRHSDPGATSLPDAMQTLSTVRQIGVMGDLHGDLEHVLQVSRTLADRDVRVLLQLGDFGVLWPGRNWMIDLKKLSRVLARHRQTLFFVDGNHDWHTKLRSFLLDEDGIRWIASNVGHLPRGYRTQIGGTFTLAALGGANSSDRSLRTEGEDWWPEEQITEADLRKLGHDRAHVLVGHEAPLMDDASERKRAAADGITPAEAAYARESRVMFRRAVLQTRPLLTLGGHYHRFIDETLPVPGTPPVQTRVVVLDMNGAHRISQAILDTTALDIEFLYRNGAAVHTTERGTEP